MGECGKTEAVMRQLSPVPLDQVAFAEFGTVLDRDLTDQFLINQGTTTRFHRMAEVKIAPPKGSAILSIFRSTNRGYPFAHRALPDRNIRCTSSGSDLGYQGRWKDGK